MGEYLHFYIELGFLKVYTHMYIMDKSTKRWTNDGNQSGPSLKDLLQVPDGPITRSRAKKIKEQMQGLVQSTWDEASKSLTIKVGLKEGEPILIHLI